MDEEAETKAIEKWLRLVDEPLAEKAGDKRGDRKDTEPKDGEGNKYSGTPPTAAGQ